MKDKVYNLHKVIYGWEQDPTTTRQSLLHLRAATCKDNEIVLTLVVNTPRSTKPWYKPPLQRLLDNPPLALKTKVKWKWNNFGEVLIYDKTSSKQPYSIYIDNKYKWQEGIIQNKELEFSGSGTLLRLTINTEKIVPQPTDFIQI